MSRTLLLALTTAVLVVAAVVVAVGASPNDDVIARASVHRDGDHALRAEVRLRTTEPTPVTVMVADADGEGFRVTPADPLEGTGTVPLLGLRPSSEYTVSLEATGETWDLGTVRTGKLPAGVPTTELLPDPAPDAGLTLLQTRRRPPEGEGGLRDEGTLVAVDGTGEVVWYQRLPLGTEDITATVDGDLLATYHEMGVIEVDPATGIERSWIGSSGEDATDRRGRPVAPDGAIVVDTDQMHHEVLELHDGNLLTLSREVREVTYPEPICEDSPADGVERGSERTVERGSERTVERGSERTTEQVAADTVVEFDPETGEVVREFSLWEVLDPMDHLDRLVEAEFCGPHLEPRYPQGGVRDWTHGNGIEIDEPRNVVWVSLRHTDQIVGLRWQDDADGPAGELVHRLGRGGTFELTEGEWFRHQHAPELQPDGSLLVHGSGNHREGTSLDGAPGDLPAARAIRYQLDVEAGTATQVWQHRFPRFAEVEPSSGETVWDRRTRDPEGETGWGAYRAERLPHLYPPDWQVSPL